MLIHEYLNKGRLIDESDLEMVNTKKINPVHILFRVSITFVKANGERIKAKGEIGNSILDIVVNNDLDLDGYGMDSLRFYKTFLS